MENYVKHRKEINQSINHRAPVLFFSTENCYVQYE